VAIGDLSDDAADAEESSAHEVLMTARSGNCVPCDTFGYEVKVLASDVRTKHCFMAYLVPHTSGGITDPLDGCSAGREGDRIGF
jgi:hypothetical protein